MKHILLLSIFIFSFSTTLAATETSWQKAQHDSLNYLIYQPKTSGDKKYKLMISLHGCAQKAEDLAALGNLEKAAEKYAMIVVLPAVPNGGVVLGCWDYYGQDQNENNHDNGPLISLTEDLLNDSRLNIDRAQVYVSGLSSGSTQAALLGCMRPDLFVGVGLNSGPAVGTEMGEISSPKTSSDQVAQFCQDLAGVHRADLAKQKTVVIYDERDYVVNPAHSLLTSQALQKIYTLNSSDQLDLTQLEGANTGGNGKVYHDGEGIARLAVIMNTGLGHAWAAGSGSGATQHYVNPNSINFPDYLGRFFSESNPRVH